MDAVKFLQERKRMYESGAIAPSVMLGSNYDPASVVKVVEEWAAEHPRKTRQGMFLKQYPEGEIDSRGCLMLCPKRISADCRKRYGNCTSRLCADCRKEFWGQEVE